MNSKEMMNNNVYKVFVKYVSLSILSMLGLSFYVLADTLFIANGVGSDGLTALNLVLPFYSFINGIGLMLGIGSATWFSILKGEGRLERVDKVFTQAIYLALLIGIMITVIGLLFSNDIAILLGADSYILPLSEVYLKTIVSFSTAFILNNILVAFVRNDGNPKLAMTAMLAGSLSNIVLDYIFIFPLKMGMFGAAFATGLAPIISMCILSLHFINKKNNFKLVLGRVLTGETINIFSLGIPSFITELSSGIIMLLFNYTILRLEGNIGVAAYGIIANLALIGVALFSGIAQGIQPIISTNYGARNMDNIRKIFISSCFVAVAFGILFYVGGAYFSKEISLFFNKDGNPILTQMASKGIRIYFVAFIIMGINIVSTTLFTCLSKPKQSFIISITRGCLAVVPIVLILPNIFGIIGVWLTIPLTELITLLISTILLGGYWLTFTKKDV